MAKCQHCGRNIENTEIMYRPGTTGGYRNRSIRLCSGCVESHDRGQESRKFMKVVLGSVALFAVIVCFVYLLKYR